MEFDLRTDDLSATDLEDNFDFDYSVGEVFCITWFIACGTVVHLKNT